MRKWPNVSILNLIIKSNSEKWNRMLTECFVKNDLNTLVRLRYGIQADMSDLSKANLNSSQVMTHFLRFNNSLEKTIRKIFYKGCKTYEDKKKKQEFANKFIKENAF